MVLGSQSSTQVQCRICGKWKAFLNNNHFVKCHRITREEYCEQFGIDDPFRLVAPAYRKSISRRADYALFSKEELYAEFWRIYRQHGEASGKLFSEKYYPVFNQLITLHGRWKKVLLHFGFDPDTERLNTAPVPIEVRVKELKQALESDGAVSEKHTGAWNALRQRLGSAAAVYETLGIRREEAFPERFKAADGVLEELRDFYEKRRSGDTSNLPSRLYGIIRLKFGSLENALKAAGIDKHEFFFKKLWSEEDLLGEIRRLACSGEDLRQDVMVRTRSDLVRAANKYFGGWYPAIEAAGFDSLDYRHKRFRKIAYIRETWSRERLAKEMAELKRSGRTHALEEVRLSNPELVVAAAFYFGCWPIARRAHGLMTFNSLWTEEKVLQVVRERKERGEPIAGGWVNLNFHSLYRAGRSFFGTWQDVLDAADGSHI